MKFLKIIFLLFILIFSFTIKSAVAQGSATSSFSPSTATAGPNQDFTVNIPLNSASATLKMRMYQINMNFDQSKVRVKSINYRIGIKSDVLGGDDNQNLTQINSGGQIKLIGELTTAAGFTLPQGVATSFVELIFTSQTAEQYNINVAGTSFLKNIKADLSLETISISASSMTVNQAASPILSPTPSPPPSGGPLACPKFELTGLTKSGTTNSEGGPIYQASSAGSNNQIDFSFTPSDGTPVITTSSQPAGAPQLNITETNIGTSVVRIANIPSNTSATADNVYMVRAKIVKSTDQVNCLPIQVIVPKTTSGGVSPPSTTCPSDIQSTEVKFKNADNTGSWTGQKTIFANQTVKVAGFHNKLTPDSVPADISNLLVSGPNGFSTTHPNGAIFTPPADLPPGVYVFTAQTSDKVGDKCTGTASLIVTATPAPPAPVKNTLCYAFGEGDAAKTAIDALSTNDAATFCKTVATGGKVDNILVFPYTADPDTTTFKNYTFKDPKPAIKTFFVKFFGLEGAATKVTQTIQKSITFNPPPAISTVTCTSSSSGPGTQITITGKFFGPQGNGSVKLANVDAAIDNWDPAQNTIKAHIDQRLDGKNNVSATFDNGTVVTPPQGCTVNTATVGFKLAYQCKDTKSTSNVAVKVFEALAAGIQANIPNPILQQTISIDSGGNPQNFAPKFEKSKKYELIVKAPGALAKRIDFDTSSGGTVNLQNGDAITLTQGDIAPVNAPDGKVNAFDKSELIRQWNAVTDVTRTGDLNGDGRVNSIDYACMRQNINAEDEKFGFISAPALPTTSAPNLPTSTAPNLPAGT